MYDYLLCLNVLQNHYAIQIKAFHVYTLYYLVISENPEVIEEDESVKEKVK